MVWVTDTTPFAGLVRSPQSTAACADDNTVEVHYVDLIFIHHSFKLKPINCSCEHINVSILQRLIYISTTS